MAPTISVRKYIKWGDEKPSEPTSTLVLTSPRKFYVDTRILLPADATTPISSMQIDWAFAGTSSTTPANGNAPEHTVWTHWVDSTTANPETVKDEGDMIKLASGDSVERGQMVNPKTGKVEKYEESWADIKPSGENAGWVVQTQDEGVRGMIVRIGGFAQGILRKGNQVGIKRWRDLGGEQGWDPLLGIGECDVPAELFGEKSRDIAEGDKFLFEGLEWVCVEKFALR